MLVGGRGEELMDEKKQRIALASLVAFTAVLHVGSAVGFDMLTKRLQRPRVSCPMPITAPAGSNVTLSGEATGVAVAAIRSTQWAVVNSPPGSAYRFVAARANPTTFTANAPGQYELSFTVTDSFNRNSSCNVVITMSNEVELEAPPPPPPPPVAIPEPPAPTPEPPPQRVVEHRAEPPPQNAPPPTPQPAAPPPAPTEAAPIMTVEDEFSNEQETAASGNNVNATGETTNGGVMRSTGVTGSQIGGGDGGTGRAAPAAVAAAPTVDYSSHANFQCDESAARDQFPDAAREAGIMEMTVNLRVTVDASGHVTRIEPASDPGFGFVAAAMQVVRRHCEITPARDRSGAAVAETKRFAINFVME